MSFNNYNTFINEANKPLYKKGQKVEYQLDHKGGVGKYANAVSKSKNIDTGVIKNRSKTLSSFKYVLTSGLELYQSEILGVAESVIEGYEFKHINKDENKIKLAIKDVEKRQKLKANRNKPLEYEQLSLNKIMLSKVLGRGKLDKEYNDAWKKLKKEFDLKESLNEARDSVYIKQLVDTFKKFKLDTRKYEIMMDSLFGGGSKIPVLRPKGGFGDGAIIDDAYKEDGSNYKGYIEIRGSKSGRPIPGKSKFDNIDDAMVAATKYVDTIKESIVNEAKFYKFSEYITETVGSVNAPVYGEPSEEFPEIAVEDLKKDKTYLKELAKLLHEFYNAALSSGCDGNKIKEAMGPKYKGGKLKMNITEDDQFIVDSFGKYPDIIINLKNMKKGNHTKETIKEEIKANLKKIEERMPGMPSISQISSFNTSPHLAA